MRDEQEQIYNIPSNFIDEGRIINGIFKTRNFIEGIIVGGIVALLVWNLCAQLDNINSKIAWTSLTAVPCFLISYYGFDGYPLSTSLLNLRKWLKSKSQMTYDFSPKPLKESPLDALESRETPGDLILDAVEKQKQKRIEKLSSAFDHDKSEIEYTKDLDIDRLLLFKEEQKRSLFKTKENEDIDITLPKELQTKKVTLYVADPTETEPDIEIDIVI